MTQSYDGGAGPRQRCVYRAADGLHVRMAGIPHSRTAMFRDCPPLSEAGEAELLAVVRMLGEDAAIRTALELSSPELADRLDAVVRGRTPDLAGLRRLARSGLSYHLRMGGRPTPFGALAGVAPARFGAEPAVRMGGASRLHLVPDAGWLATLVAGLEGRPDVLAGLRVVVDERCWVRGDRLVVPGPPERTLRLTAMLRRVLDLAAVPFVAGDLAGELDGGSSRALGFLAELARRGVLLTELLPPPDAPDPLGHVVVRVPPPVAVRLRGLLPSTVEVGDPGAAATLRRVRDRMAAAGPAVPPLQGDLVIDADVTLPRAVGAEVARAAALAWTLAPRPADLDPMVAHHEQFLERYGVGRLVPLCEILDPTTGLGPPPARPVAPAARTRSRRDETLLELAGEALASGRLEIELEPGPAAALTVRPAAAPPPVDVLVQVLARSVADLAAGRFRVVFGSARYAAPTGTTAGRFARLLPGPPGSPTDPLAVEVLFAPTVARAANLMRAPVLAGRIEVGTYPHGPRIRLRDVLVGSDGRRLWVVDGTTGKEIHPVATHLADLAGQAPPEARYLVELGREPSWAPWDWGAADGLPVLPAVRIGRSVLAPAMWTPGPGLRSAGGSFAEWDRRFGAWCRRYHVPEVVDAGVGDERLELELSAPIHRDLLRSALRRGQVRTLTALPSASADERSWLGGRRGEFVVTLLPAGPGPGPARPVPPLRSRDRASADGWVSAAIRCSPAQELEILVDHLPEYAADLPAAVDAWFFVRYRHPYPQLRLRLHGGGDAALTGLHGWAADLRRRGLAGPVELGEYDPELERYGGPDAMAAAHRLFCRDSAAALALLPALADSNLSEAVVLAANQVDLLRALGGLDWAAWLGTAFRSGSGRRGRRELVAAAERLVDPAAAVAQFGPEVGAAWRRRAHAAAEYGAQVRAGGWTKEDTVRRAILHLSANRLLGPDRDAELLALTLARAAVQRRPGKS